MNEQAIINAIVFSTVVIVGLIAVVMIVLLEALRRRARQEKLFLEQRLALEQELRTIESETREATLSQLSAELHDNIGQMLTVAHMQINTVLVSPNRPLDLIKPASASLSAAIRQVRLLSHSLNTDFVTHGGLLRALENESQRLQGLGTHSIVFQHNGEEPSITKDQSTVVFRMAQEILSNALRHAAAKSINIELAPKDSRDFVLEISDDGKGFDLEAALRTAKGLGLHNMMKRAQMANLELVVTTAPGAGSRFLIKKKAE